MVPVLVSITGVLVMPISGIMSLELTSPVGTVVIPAPGLRKLACHNGAEFVPELIHNRSGVGSDVLLDTVQELRDAGAEAIQISGVRIVASTAFTGTPGALLIGGTSVSRPYEVTAIGPASTLAEAMRIPGGVVDSLAANQGASVRIREEGSVSILHVSALPQFAHARPKTRR